MPKQPITVEDFAKFTLVGRTEISPNAQKLIFEQQTASIKDDEYRTQLFLTDLDTHAIRPLTTQGKRNHSPKWSPDGTQIAFISDRAYGSQLWCLPADGGEAVQITRFQHGISSITWSPNGSHIYALVPAAADGEVAVLDENLSESEAKELRDKESKEWSEGPKRFQRIYYKGDSAGLSHLRYQQLVEIDVAGKTFRQLTRGDRGIGDFTPTPDGSYLYFNQGRDPEFEWWYSDLYRLSIESGNIELISDKLKFGDLRFSKDGSKLAVLAMDDSFDKYKSAAHAKLYLLSSNGDILSHLTADFPDDLGNSNLSDLRADFGESFTWSSDEAHIYVLSTREGQSEILRFRTDGKTPHGEVIVGGPRDIYTFALAGEERLVYAFATQTDPSKVAVTAIGNGPFATREERLPTQPMQTSPALSQTAVSETVIHQPNAAFVAELQLSEPEPFWYQSAEDWWVQGWVMRPANFEAGKKYPVILEIHGGPQLNFGHAMFHEMQWFAAQGYAIVFTNPRGGKSYGQTFVNAVRHHYGENDAADVLNGLDAALNQFDFLDSNRVAVTGGSYGGFMTNWLVGHTNRFFAAVSQRSISNWISFFGCSDIGPLFVESQLVDVAEGNLETLWRMSPLAYVQNVQTPILMLHSEQDLRCPMEQAEQFYTWLRRAGKETELFRIPNASHGLSRNGKPSLRVKRLEAIFGYIHDRLPQA